MFAGFIHCIVDATLPYCSCSFLQILWSNRLVGDTGKRCKISVDGTDFRIPQQYPKKPYYSYKYNGPGLRYEVAVCIRTGEIVWINGPFNPGQFMDLMVFRLGLKQKLLFAGEKAQADGIYACETRTIIAPNEFDGAAVQRLKDDVRARHETVNKRLKQFGILKRIFRQELCKHKAAFTAVAVITQIAIRNGEELYEVEYGAE